MFTLEGFVHSQGNEIDGKAVEWNNINLQAHRPYSDEEKEKTTCFGEKNVVIKVPNTDESIKALFGRKISFEELQRLCSMRVKLDAFFDENKRPVMFRFEKPIDELLKTGKKE